MSTNGIAIIGLAGRFPGADNVEAFWENLVNGVESSTRLDDETLRREGVSQQLIDNPDFVKVSYVVEGAENFDAELFQFTPREAEITDPQHRMLLECCYEALDHAGYSTDSYSGHIGVYAGVGSMSYFVRNLSANPELLESVGPLRISIGNEKSFATTMVSYKLNLRGPSVNVDTACSTSLVAIHQACQSLLSYECDIALSGGVSIDAPQKTGMLYREGSIVSPDGHCRPFDSQAKGTVKGNGAGVVVLKRVEDALRDGDFIHAVILGSAINNDGSLKLGYTASSIDGQVEVVADALVRADVDAATIGYVETHGTGTILGDPIEVAALARAFAGAAPQGACAIGSVKANIGHLDIAAGVAGLITTVLALQHGELPPSLHFESPNQK
ncbi:MAG: beta-ketoacyl synthase N-terminal-like domain-containing protein, partial [Lysobacter sp.]